MKITAIETIALRDADMHGETVVRVHTDEGLSGIGQAESPSLVIDAIIHCRGGLLDLLRGEDPTQVERLWQKMYDGTGLFGRRGVTIAAIGAVETALWDIAGQALGRPVCELIWRSFATTSVEARDQAARHALCHRLSAGRDATTRCASASGLAVARGLRAVKLEEWPGGFGHGSVANDVADRQAGARDPGRGARPADRRAEPLAGGGTRAAHHPRHRAVPRLFRRGALPRRQPGRLCPAGRDAWTRASPWATGAAPRASSSRTSWSRGEVDVVQPSSVRSGGI